ncbi:bacterial regulatory helix-turn-helix, lysR family protein [Burkholderia pseudomallei]|nr:bacterial regulatory helix-turn-helix, lysR family protein [Burkholderia pseudomallei]
MKHIRGADLNLLLAAFVLLEERQVSKAADRYHLSQPAMSRMLQRLRDTFGDELLVRTRGGFEPTVRGRYILHELGELLPRLDALLRGGLFDPTEAEDTFRVACTDYATTILGPRLFERVFREAPNVSMDVVAWHDHAFEAIEHGRLDLVLWPNEVPDTLYSETLFEDDFVCMMSSDHPSGDGPLVLRDYLRFPHAVVSVLGGKQTIVEQRLHDMGVRRAAGLRVSYFSGAITAIARTALIATVPRRLAMLYRDRANIRIVEAPAMFGKLSYKMVWHPRADGDLALQWLRQTIRAAANDIDSIA